jgi:hypothetical protein
MEIASLYILSYLDMAETGLILIVVVLQLLVEKELGTVGLQKVLK